MNIDAENRLLSFLGELSSIPGVRGALITTDDGALFSGDGVFNQSIAADLARTVRRMVVASATVGAPLAELLINFGRSRMMIIPLREESNLAILLDRDNVTSTVRSVVKLQHASIKALLRAASPDAAESGVHGQVTSEPEDEVDRLMLGELGPVLRDVQGTFSAYAESIGKAQAESAGMMREQMREWLLCCNPSPYTFPLLIDGLAQLLGDNLDRRASFMNDVQAAMRRSKIWGAKSR
jgi:predicted regulator of Ras-like GTPase activity (Roadblock/LC7/MglB family)